MSKLRRAKKARDTQKRKAKAQRWRKSRQDYLDGDPEVMARLRRNSKRAAMSTVLALMCMDMHQKEG